MTNPTGTTETTTESFWTNLGDLSGSAGYVVAMSGLRAISNGASDAFVNAVAAPAASIFAVSQNEADRQISRLVEFKARQAGWDGREASPPNQKSLQHAIDFLSRIKCLPFPVPMASVGIDGNATLFWKTSALYADIELSEDGKLGYLLQITGQPERDKESEMPLYGLPADIMGALIAAHPPRNK